MLGWCAILFGLGILSFLDTIFNYGEIFRQVNSTIFMMISLGLLIRVSMKMKIKRVEGLIAKVAELEEQVTKFKASATQNSPKPKITEKEAVH